jgi:phage tail sheath gpL-like
MSGSISFKYFPAPTWRVPGFYGEFDASQANTAIPVQRALLVGQMLSSGTATANVPILAYSLGQVQQACGTNSMLSLMYQAYRAQDAFGECWILPVADNGSGTAATGTVTVTGPATGQGVLSLYIAGILVPVAVNSGDSATVIAANIAAEMAQVDNLPCTGSAASAVVTLTALHKGAAQNDIDLRVNYRAIRGGEALPPGVGVTLPNLVTGSTAGTLAGGATNPTLTTALANLGVRTFDFIAMPYTDTTSMAAIAALLSDQSGRWSAIEGLYGHAFYAYRGTVAARNTFGQGLNNQHQTVIGYFDSPTPAWLECADWAGGHAVTLRANPAVGVVGQPLNLLAPPIANQDTPAEMNVMLDDGMSTFTVDAASQCRIGRSITTYQTNASGAPDDSYLNTNLLFQAMFVVRYIAAQVMTQYQNKILVDDGAVIAAGSPATTPTLIFQAVCGMYAYLSSQFVVQNPATFAQNGYAQKGTKGQVLLFLPIDFSDQVIQVAALIAFRQTT